MAPEAPEPFRGTENELENSLFRAGRSVAFIPGLYQKLVASDLVVVSGVEEAATNLATMGQFGETEFALAYTSERFVQRLIQPDVRLYRSPAPTFLRELSGKGLILNPSSHLGKVFLPEEVQGILRDELGLTIRRRDPMTLVILCLPPEPVDHLLDDLAAAFIHHGGVEAAYSVDLFVRGEGQFPLIGVQSRGDSLSVLRTAALVAGAFPFTPPVEVVELKPGCKLSESILESVAPFWRRRSEET